MKNVGFRISNMIEKEKQIDELLSRGVGEFIDPDGVFREKLLKKARGEHDKPVIIKYGIDPTRPDIHLGHAVCFRKLREFQDLGCKVVFLVGDFTARIGDPTGKNKVRPEIDQEEVDKNVESYFKHLNKVINLDQSVFSWVRNSDWFYAPSDIIPGKNTKTSISTGHVDEKGEPEKKEISINPNSFLGKSILYANTRMQVTHLHKGEIQEVSLRGLLWTLRHITLAGLVERDMFDKRIRNNDPLFMHEMLYPVLQGVDSHLLVKIYGSCDLELGGTDQTFNMLMGRSVMEINEQDPQSTISLKILEGTDGKEKMSKSLGNYISITEEPKSMFGKVMSIPDNSIVNYFELCTDISLDEVDVIKKKIESDTLNPRDAKLRLGREIVKIYHGEEAAREAEAYFVSTFSKREIPSDIREVKLTGEMSLLDFLVQEGFATSRGDARRKIEQGGVEIDGVKVLDRDFTLTNTGKSSIVKCGKKDFARVVFSTL